MRITKEAPATQTELVDVICNRCGKSCKDREGNVSNISATSIEIYGHFGSKHFADCHRYNFDLCEDCAFELARTFKHPPEVRCVGPWAESDAEPEITWETTLARNPL